MLPIITLTTDFGTHDSYVGVMKGVMLSICPQARLIDITHEIAPQNIAAAARVLEQIGPYFPPHTIHLVVVDPGVGSERQPIALATPQGQYVGPNNGVFGQVWQAAQARWSPTVVQAVVLTEPRYWMPEVSATFHGRDIFAPVAAHLAGGTALEALGPPLTTIQQALLAEPVWETPDRLCGKIVAIDHFGNCISNISTALLKQLGPRPTLTATFAVRTGEAAGHMLSLALRRTYADVPSGTILSLVGSNGYLELAVRDGNASQICGVTIGDEVRVQRL
ncbi:MAG: SAM-dependent chlorinase/fluorinase [Chloroflexaceae bacterium]|nr:SAM-dependent chlorinase/fluorinase [Chloroflexaceae bacterium]